MLEFLEAHSQSHLKRQKAQDASANANANANASASPSASATASSFSGVVGEVIERILLCNLYPGRTSSIHRFTSVELGLHLLTTWPQYVSAIHMFYSSVMESIGRLI